MAQELYTNLQIAYTCPDNQQRAQAEQSLVKQVIEDFQNFQFIAKLIESQDPLSEQAASLLNSVVIRMMMQKNSLSINHAQALCSILTSQYPQLKIKLMLQKAFCQIVKQDRSIKTEIENKMKELLQSEQFWQIQAGILFFRILVDSLELQSYNQIITTGYEWITDFFSLTVTIIKPLQDSKNELSLDYLNTLRFFSQSLADFCERIFKIKGQNREQVLPIQNIVYQSQHFSAIAMAILSYSPDFGQQIKSCVISTTGNESYDNKINEIKSFLFKSYYLSLNVLLNQRSKSEQKKGSIAPYLPHLSQLLLYSVLQLLQHEKVAIILNKPFQSTIIMYLLRLLANLGQQTELYAMFSDAKIAIITDIVYPFLVTTNNDYIQMREHPEEFVNLALDTVDKQESDIPRTAAAALLETLCDHIDGSTTFLAQLAVLVTQSSINEQLSQPIALSDQQMQLIGLIQEKKIFKEITAIDRIEASLSVLTIMSYLIQKRNDIIALMDQLLTDNYLYFSQTKEQIIKVRLSLFFGYFCDNLFKKDAQSKIMIQYLQILISYVQPNEPVVLYQAIDALKDVFEDDELKSKTQQLILSLFPALCAGLSYSIYERHFEMIVNLLKRSPQLFQQNEQLLAQLMEVLVQRIMKEQDLANNGQSDRYFYMNRCWTIIRAIPEQDEFTHILPRLEESILKLYQMLANADKIDFDEDLIQFISTVIQKIKQVTTIQIQILPYFAKIIIKQQGRLGYLYQTLNHYIQYGKQSFMDENIQAIYFDLAFKNLNSEEHYDDIEIGEGALLIQLAIQELQTNIKKPLLQQLIQQTVLILSKNEMTNVLRSRITGILLSLLYTLPELTYEILGEHFEQNYAKVIQTQYSPGYDAKLFVLTMSSLILKNPNLLTPQLITRIVAALISQEKYEKDQLFSHANNDSFDEEDDEEDDENYEDEDEIQQAQQQIEQFSSQLVKIDEFTHFRNAIFALKSKYPSGIDQLKKGLDQPTANKLGELLSYIRVDCGDGSDAARKLIKPLRRKKNI